MSLGRMYRGYLIYVIVLAFDHQNGYSILRSSKHRLFSERQDGGDATAGLESRGDGKDLVVACPMREEMIISKGCKEEASWRYLMEVDGSGMWEIVIDGDLGDLEEGGEEVNGRLIVDDLVDIVSLSHRQGHRKTCGKGQSGVRIFGTLKFNEGNHVIKGSLALQS
ncbi:hypothetical protein Tco_0374322 [Tanacetum coccineum]